MRLASLLITFILSFFLGRANASPESDFWNWFQQNDASLFNFERDQERTFGKLATEMHKVHPSLTFEFGPKQNGRREFVISADGIRNAFSKVESLAAAAPQLPRWKVIKFRPRRAPFDIEYSGISVKATSVRVALHPEGRRVGVTVMIPGYSDSAKKTYIGIAFLLLDQALGEYDVETRLGTITVHPASTPTVVQAVSLSKLPEVFDAHFQGK